MSDLISRCELFNRLATIPAPAEANEFKAEVYEIIQSMETVDVAYFCNGTKCDRCSPECELTRDSHYAAPPDKAIVIDQRGYYMENGDIHKDPEREYLELICEIQHNKVVAGDCHVGPSAEWCIFGRELKAAVESLAEKRRGSNER